MRSLVSLILLVTLAVPAAGDPPAGDDKDPVETTETKATADDAKTHDAKTDDVKTDDVKTDDAKASDTPADDGLVRLLFLPKDGPVRVDVKVHFGGESIEQRWASGSQALFDRLDADNDEKLSGEEYRRAPWVKVSGAAARPTNFVGEFFGGITGRLRKSDDEATKMRDYAEFAKEMRAKRPPYAVQGAAVVSRGKELFEWLDQNGDKRLNSKELMQMHHVVARLDRNHDRVLQVDELNQFKNPNFSQRNVSRNTPPRRVTTLNVLGESNYALGMQIIRQYNGEEDAVDVSTLGGTSSSYDTNQDDKLDIDELQQWLGSSPAAFTLSVKPEAGKPAESTIELDKASVDGLTLKTDGRVRASFMGRGAYFETEWLLWRTNQYTSFLESNFMYADTDKNDYLDEKEAARSIYGTSFREMDTDGNKMVFEEEVKAYGESLSNGTQGITLSLHDKGQSLFSMLDENVDQTISVREAAKAIDLLKRFDSNQDGEIEAQELLPTYQVSVDYTAPDGLGIYFQTTGFNPAMRYNNSENSGWVKMLDINLDGEVSRFEFPYSKQTFDELDKNQDGAIDNEEASAGVR